MVVTWLPGYLVALFCSVYYCGYRDDSVRCIMKHLALYLIFNIISADNKPKHIYEETAVDVDLIISSNDHR